MLSKSKYVGTKQNDLLTIYKLFIRCLVEYCSVVWHSSLTEQQSNDIEKIQAVSLKVIYDLNTKIIPMHFSMLSSKNCPLEGRKNV